MKKAKEQRKKTNHRNKQIITPTYTHTPKIKQQKTWTKLEFNYLKRLIDLWEDWSRKKKMEEANTQNTDCKRKNNVTKFFKWEYYEQYANTLKNLHEVKTFQGKSLRSRGIC